MFDTRTRCGASVALGAVVLMLAAARGFGQQSPSASQQTPTGLPPSSPTQQSPSGLLIPVQPPPAPPSMLMQMYKPVTAHRLKQPEDGDWLMVRRTYDGWGYSPLDQITPANVNRLQPVWMMSTSMNNGHQAPPIVNFKDSPNWGPILTTGGGLVFSGGTNDRLFRAYDATTGDVLWEQPTNSGVYAPPSSFMVDGKQYVAVVSGWGQDARSMESRINGVSLGHYPDVPEGGVIWVFAVK